MLSGGSRTHAEDVSLAVKARVNHASAEVILGLLLERLAPTSIVDVGCGVGTWLAVARRLGIEDVHGVDLESSELDIPEDCFTAHDLEREFRMDRTFDIAMSLEVAEHLSPAAGQELVTTLVGLAPVVVFSAAVPGQGGTSHINERWQDEWAADFAEWGYVPTDPIRPLIWDDSRVRYYYAQNLLVYVREDVLGRFPASGGLPLRVVHPRLYEVTRGLFPVPGRARPRDFLRFVAGTAGIRR